jgi:hypothetical protein
MEAKEKAKELVEKYLSMENALNVVDLPYMTLTKQCALIAVDEILKVLENELLDLYDTARDCPINKKHTKFFNEVKQEILKL